MLRIILGDGYHGASRSRLPDIIRLGITMKRHIDGILAAIRLGIEGHNHISGGRRT